jgi:hypothetical protein
LHALVVLSILVLAVVGRISLFGKGNVLCYNDSGIEVRTTDPIALAFGIFLNECSIALEGRFVGPPQEYMSP